MRRHLAVLLAGVFLALPAAGCSAQPSPSGLSAPKETAGDAAFGRRVRAYLLAHPEVIQEAVQALDARQSAETAARAGESIRAHAQALNADPRDPVGGNVHGARTMVEFFDYRCPYCKVAAPQLPAFLAKHPDVRLVYKEFPILSEASEHAARAALAAARQGKYGPVHLALMKLPTLTDATIEQALRDNGVDLARAKADAASPAVTRQLDDVHALAAALGANGTPSFVVGDQISAGWIPTELDGFLKAK